ncbi:hypothetical protein ACFQ7F_40825 [Streptomyces sp. NPDC056486]|uniref:hypothetical protein n=1 Tax=Streptomyces sp. NPDC056486 TaxID=3345835 RepID=UPI0036CE85A4
MSRLRTVLSVVLLAACALFVGACHGHHGLAPAGTSVVAPAHHVCPGAGHAEHAGAGRQAVGASAERKRGERGGGGRAAAWPFVRWSGWGSGGGSGRAGCARTRAGPPLAGQRLLVAIGVDRN